MVVKKFTITNKQGIHARPAQLFVKEASRFKSAVYVSKNGREVNGKSIMGVLMLEAGPDSEIIVRIEGEDEYPAMKAIETIVVDLHFNEE
ncbi:phosphocarrier protein HPr [candidate division KSB1 bacterium RBG_16_48_16]|nr:MAG: phosphocarrier protein HPr [candidate division KSB1 bacterium RBG_16_48_16]